MIELGDMSRPVGVHYFYNQRPIDTSPLDSAKYPYPAYASNTSAQTSSEANVCELQEHESLEEKACAAQQTLDPVSFDHCYISCQRSGWSSKNPAHGVPRIRKLGLFNCSTGVAIKKPKGHGEKNDIALDDSALAKLDEREDVSSETGTSMADESTLEPSAVVEVVEGYSHDRVAVLPPVNDSFINSASEPIVATVTRRSPAPAGVSEACRAGSQASTINLSGGFIQFRESQSVQPSSTVFTSFTTKPPAPLIPESHTCGRSMGMLSCSGIGRFSAPSLPTKIVPAIPPPVSDSCVSRKFIASDRAASLAPILEKYRPLSKTTIRSTYDLDDTDQSVYDRIRIALQKSEASKQQQNKHKLDAKDGLPEATSLNVDAEKPSSKGGNKPTRKRKESGKGNGKTRARDANAINSGSIAKEEADYTTRCWCGLNHNDELMIQCDVCEVWQHCVCVGLKSSAIPEKYLCELCNPRELPLTSDEARALQMAKLESMRIAVLKRGKSQRSSKGDANVATKGRKTRPQVIGSDGIQCSGELQRLVKSMATSEELNDALSKIRPTPPCKVLLVAPKVHGLVVAYTLAPNVPIVECMGYASLLKDRKGNARCSFNADRILIDQFKVSDDHHVDLCLRLPTDDTWLHHLRRSCKPNAKISVLVDDGKLRFFLVSTKQIDRGWEISIPFDFDYKKCSKQVSCACETSNERKKKSRPCLVEQYNRGSKKRKKSKTAKSGAKGQERQGIKERRNSKMPKKKRFKVKLFPNINSRKLDDRSKMGKEQFSDEAKLNDRGEPRLKDENGSDESLDKREQQKLLSILNTIELLETRSDLKRQPVQAVDVEQQEELDRPPEESAAKKAVGSDFSAIKMRWLSEPVPEVDVNGRPAGETKDNDDVGLSNKPASRNELGISTLLASAVYLNNHAEESAVPKAKEAQTQGGHVEEETKLAQEEAQPKKVRKLSLEEYRRLKNRSLDVKQTDRTDDNVPMENEAVNSRPISTERLSSLLTGNSSKEERSSGEILNINALLDKTLQSFKSINNTKAFSKSPTNASEATEGPVEQPEKSVDDNAEENDEEEAAVARRRVALADRLESMRDLFGVKLKTEEGCSAQPAGGAALNYAGQVCGATPPTSVAPYYASTSNGFAPGYSIPSANFSQSNGCAPLTAVPGQLQTPPAPSQQVAAALAYYSRVPPPPLGYQGTLQDYMRMVQGGQASTVTVAPAAAAAAAAATTSYRS